MVSEGDLLEVFRKKDHAGYLVLYSTYAPTLYGVIVKITPNFSVATNILRDSFLSIWLGVANCDTANCSLFAWMLRITIEQCHQTTKIPRRVLLGRLNQSSMHQDTYVDFMFQDNSYRTRVIIDDSEMPCFVFAMIADETLIDMFGDDVSIKTDFENCLSSKYDSPELMEFKRAIFFALKNTPEYIAAKQKFVCS